MSCPHCGVDVVAGTKICTSCGRSTSSQLTFARSVASPTSEAPEPPPATRDLSATTGDIARPEPIVDDVQDAPSAPALCRGCLREFEPADGESDASVCPTCRGPAPTAPAPVPAPVAEQVTIHPVLPDRPRPQPRQQPSQRVLRPIQQPQSRVGPAMAAVGLALCLACVAVVVARRGKEPTSRYLADVATENATFVVAPPHQGAARIDTTLSLTVVHQGPREVVATRIEDLMRLEQRSLHESEITWVKDGAGGVELDAVSDCRVTMQSGTVEKGDARDHRAYPWERFHGAKRLLVPSTGVLTAVAGEAPVVGRDVPACLTLHDVGAPSGAVAFGSTWRALIVLPLLATRDGAVFPAGFPCEVKYVGRRSVDGSSAYALTVRGVVPSLLPEALGDMNHLTGTLNAALFFDAATGLLVEAHANVDATAWRERDRVEDRVHVVGKLDARRR